MDVGALLYRIIHFNGRFLQMASSVCNVQERAETSRSCRPICQVSEQILTSIWKTPWIAQIQHFDFTMPPMFVLLPPGL